MKINNHSIGQKISDKVASGVGSWKFIIIQSIILFIWILVNINSIVHFDPYPFILLNLCLSFQAAYTASIIMMSQNRQEKKDRENTEKHFEKIEKLENKIIKILDKIEKREING